MLASLVCALIGCGAPLGEKGVDDGEMSQIDVIKQQTAGAFDQGFGTLYREHCADCHGIEFQGSPQGPALVAMAGASNEDDDARRLSDVDGLVKSIAEGNPTRGMPAWKHVLEPHEIRNLAVYVAERGTSLGYETLTLENFDLSAETRRISLHDFDVDVVTRNLTNLVYSIEPLPDGRILVTQKTVGLGVISTEDGAVEIVEGTPPVYDDTTGMGIYAIGIGWYLDLELHPDYAENGWIYLSHADRCSGCNEASVETGQDVSMVRVVRGRIRDGKWVDEEVIWCVHKRFYTVAPETGVSARLAFDDRGHLFITIGMKRGELRRGIQDLDQPYGKIHRVRDDGAIPDDNPFLDVPGALPSIWTLGHRAPQGLDFDGETRRLWSTEMGPRGGDEVNLIEPGKNYGWPLVSNGVNYDGTPLRWGEILGIDADPADLEPPRYDMTPAPAISNFVAYHGEAFPSWDGDLLVGSLKGMTLYRLTPESDGVIEESEVLLDGISRIRDIAQDANGKILLLLEYESGGLVVRLSPAAG